MQIKQISNSFSILGLIVLFGCFSSFQKNIKYDIQGCKSPEEVRVKSTSLINYWAKNAELMVDDKYTGTDTLGFFGKPYHYFKFFFTTADSSTLEIEMQYSGSFGKKSKPPYELDISILEQNLRSGLPDVKIAIVNK